MLGITIGSKYVCRKKDMEEIIKGMISGMELEGRHPGILVVGCDVWESFNDWVQGLWSNVTGSRVNCDGLKIVISGREVVVYRVDVECGIVLYGKVG